jgi:hypothetical protein
MSLFWGMFLPWNKFYALDAIHKETLQTRWFGFAGVGYVIQVFSVYFFSALLKNSPEWNSEGTALYYALSLDQLVLPPGKILYQYPVIMKYLTLSVYYLELIVPFLLFSPAFTKPLRMFAIVSLTLLHLGIGSTLFVGLFFLIGLATLIGMLPERIMDFIHKDLQDLKKIFEPFTHRIHVPAPEIIRIKTKHVGEGILAMVLIYISVWNWQNTSYSNFKINTTSLAHTADLFGLNQNWGMFAPSVFKDDGWVILEGTTQDGKLIDLNREGALVTYKKPKNGVALFKNDRWRKYTENFLFISNNFMRPYYANFILRRWNESHPDKKVDHLKVIYMKEVTQPDYKPARPSREILAETALTH